MRIAQVIFGIGLFVVAGQAMAQTAPLLGGDTANAVVSVPELTRMENLITNVNNLYTAYNAMVVAYNRYKNCANQGLGYAPTGTALPGYNATTKCVRLPNPPLVREVRFTTDTTTGDMSAYGSTAATRMEGFMNANGCPVSQWRVCSEEELKYAFAKQFRDMDTTTVPYAWFMGTEMFTKMKFSGATSFVSNYVCSSWSSGSSGFGYAAALYNATSNGLGLTLRACSNAYHVACCR